MSLIRQQCLSTKAFSMFYESTVNMRCQGNLPALEMVENAFNILLFNLHTTEIFHRRLTKKKNSTSSHFNYDFTQNVESTFTNNTHISHTNTENR